MILNFISTIREAQASEFVMTYDKEADVLYINFDRSREASDSELFDNDVIARYDADDTLIGLTVMHATQEPEARLREAIRLSHGL